MGNKPKEAGAVNNEWQEVIYENHNCRENDKLMKCEKGVDIWECKVCGRKIELPCNFDDDMN